MQPLLSPDSTPAPYPLTWAMIHDRTRQLAKNAGRDSGDITQLDYEQAKRELTGVSDIEQQLEILRSCV